MADSGKEHRDFQDLSIPGTVRINNAQGPRMGLTGETSEKIKRKFALPPSLFKNLDLKKTGQSTSKISKSKLINIINHINFSEGYVWVHLRDPRYEEDILIHAYPQACIGNAITCKWPEEGVKGFEYHHFLNLLIDDGMSVIAVPIKLLSIDQEQFTIQMPDNGNIIGKRKGRRFSCQGITAEVSQSGFIARGEMLDFSTLSFRVRVAPLLGGSFHWLNPDQPITLTLYNGQKIVYADQCRFMDQTSSMSVKDIVLAPIAKPLHRFRSKKKRSIRVQLAPSSSIIFEHPFSGQTVQRDIHDISVTGFSVKERQDESVLVPGMILYNLQINYSGTLTIPCTAQVLYRTKEKGDLFRCGMTILDMDALTYGQLSSILGNVLDPCLHVSNKVNMEALWEFFFKTGFIYPKKYGLIESHKDEIKETYRKLYEASPDVSAYVTYQKNGTVYGHAAMIRAYERTWMVHHLAAMPVPGVTNRTGLNVLKQLLNYYDGVYHLPSVKMDYMMFYFRPENRFPDMFFGGFARDLKNLNACSMDQFAYKNYKVNTSHKSLPDKWSLGKFSVPDSYDLERFYRNKSGGLLLRALDLGHDNLDQETTLKDIYKKQGLSRDWHIYSLKYAEELKAVFIVNQSDLGLNLSELINGIKIIVTDPQGLPWDILSSAIDQLTGIYKVDSIPILVYPNTYMEDLNVSYEKNYLMWIMDTQYGGEYLEYMKNKTKIKLRYIFKFLLKKYFKR